MSDTAAGPVSAGLRRFETDLFIPRYRPLVSGEWEVRVAGLVVMPGYWSEPVMIERMVALVRRGQSWMSIAPFEIESQGVGVRLARGRVLMFGLGLGWAAAAAACLPDVTSVTVVERDSDILALHHELDIFSQLPEAARAKLRLIEGDAFTYVPDRPVDLLVPDIWQPLINDERLDEVRKMQANVNAAAIHFWGQEMELARHLVAAGRAFDAPGIAATIEETRLPLIGLEDADYPAKVEAAARRWMRGRWLPGSEPPWKPAPPQAPPPMGTL
jgi:hypothetical protein